MPNQLYQSLFGASEEVVAEALLHDLVADERVPLERLLGHYPDGVGALIHDLGGHDLADLIDALARARAEPDQPTIVLAYTIKGWGLPIAGRPLNYLRALDTEQVDIARGERAHPGDRVGQTTREPGGSACVSTRARVRRPASARAPDAGSRSGGDLVSRPGGHLDPGRRRTDPARPVAGRRTRRANRDGLTRRLCLDEPRRLDQQGGSVRVGGGAGLRGARGLATSWRVSPTGRHVELGISEMNLFLALGQFGMTRDFQREQLFPIGTLSTHSSVGGSTR